MPHAAIRMGLETSRTEEGARCKQPPTTVRLSLLV